MMVPGLPIVDYKVEILALRKAIASGVRSVSYEGKTVTYDDLNAMKQRLAFVEGLQMQQIQPGYRRPQAGFATFTRGSW